MGNAFCFKHPAVLSARKYKWATLIGLSSLPSSSSCTHPNSYLQAFLFRLNIRHVLFISKICCESCATRTMTLLIPSGISAAADIYLVRSRSILLLISKPVNSSHNTSSPPSITALQLLRAALSSSYPPNKSNALPLKFNLEVIENKPPTTEQLGTILSYLPAASSAAGSTSPDVLVSSHPTVETRPTSTEGVARLASKNLHALKWPIVVDWDGGRAAVGDVEGVKSILEELRKQRDGEVKEDEGHKPKGWFA